jgi:hypothetical protein
VDGKLSVAGLVFDLPEGWVAQQPSMRTRLAQYSLPGEAGAATLTVYCFGLREGGGVQANVDRWLGQFSDPLRPGQKVNGETIGFAQDELVCTVVKARGVYTARTMGGMGSSGQPKPGYGLYGLIIENGPQGTVFVKAIGPEVTVTAHTQALNAFAKSVRPGSS